MFDDLVLFRVIDVDKVSYKIEIDILDILGSICVKR